MGRGWDAVSMLSEHGKWAQKKAPAPKGEGLVGQSGFLVCPAEAPAVHAYVPAEHGARGVHGLYGVALEQLR